MKIILSIILSLLMVSTAFAAYQIQIRRDTAANWTSNNPTLAQGEWALETDTGKLKIGDGATAWTSLVYFGNGLSTQWSGTAPGDIYYKQGNVGIGTAQVYNNSAFTVWTNNTGNDTLDIVSQNLDIWRWDGYGDLISPSSPRISYNSAYGDFTFGGANTTPITSASTYPIVLMPGMGGTFGNVGVGSLSPGQQLDVVGTTRTIGLVVKAGGISNTTGYTQSGSSTNAFTGSTQFGSSAQGTIDINGNFDTAGKGQFGGGTGSSSEFAVQGNAAFGSFYAGSAPTNGIDVSGNVGIGTAVASSNLYVAGTGSFQGNVGIGSNSPGQILDVQGTIRAIGFNLSTTPVNNYILTSDSNGNGSWQPQGNSSQWITTINVGIGTYSNVGIGTTIPGQTLEVQGTERIYGNLGIGTTGTTTDQLDVQGSLSKALFEGNIVGANGGNVNNNRIVFEANNIVGTNVGIGTSSPLLLTTGGKIISSTIVGGLNNSTCTCTVDIWKANATYPLSVANTITSSDVPTLTAANYNQDTALTGWTLTYAKNDVIQAYVRPGCTCDNVCVTLGTAT